MENNIVCKMDSMVKSAIEDGNKSVEDLFEMFNKVLNKYRVKKGKHNLKYSKKTKKRKRDIICRPALMISDSSDNDF